MKNIFIKRLTKIQSDGSFALKIKGGDSPLGKRIYMKLKMMQHNGAMVLMVSGERQELIISEDGGCFTIELVNTAHFAAEDVQEDARVANVLPLVLDDDAPPVPELEPELDDGLFKKLVLLRKTIAVADKVAPYLIFHDKTLREMADKMPLNLQALGNISGVGQAKLEKYGPAFLDVINNVA